MTNCRNIMVSKENICLSKLIIIIGCGFANQVSVWKIKRLMSHYGPCFIIGLCTFWLFCYLEILMTTFYTPLQARYIFNIRIWWWWNCRRTHNPIIPRWHQGTYLFVCSNLGTYLFVCSNFHILWPIGKN